MYIYIHIYVYVDILEYHYHVHKYLYIYIHIYISNLYRLLTREQLGSIMHTINQCCMHMMEIHPVFTVENIEHSDNSYSIDMNQQ
jgi:hypothetical protein